MSKRKRADDDSHFKRIEAQWFIHLPPAFLASPADGAHTFLGRYLMRHLPEIDGILVSYTDLKPVGDAAAIKYDNGFFHFQVSVNLLAFSPKVGETIVGTVTKASRSHIGLLLHDIINASIPVDNIPQESYEFDEESKLWKNIHSGKKLEEGTVLRFAIHSLMHANDMMTVTGTLDSGHIDLGIVGARPKTNVPQDIPQLPPLYAPSPIPRPDRVAKLALGDGEGDSLKRKRDTTGTDDDRDTLFEGHGSLQKKKKKGKGGNAGEGNQAPVPATGSPSLPATPSGPAKPAAEANKPKDPSTMSARDLKRLQRKKEKKKEKKEKKKLDAEEEQKDIDDE